MKYQVSNNTSVKLSFTKMTQAIHRMSSTYLSMPTDYWVPTTARLKPMQSFQVAAGLYSQVSSHWFASIEGYYKLSAHMLQYTNYNSLTPPAKHWDNFVMDGKGLFYGIEADVRYHDHVSTSKALTPCRGTSGSLTISIPTGFMTSSTTVIRSTSREG
jgi:hypothetical protein